MSSSFIKQCPVCNNILSFANENTNVIKCPSCGSSINRTLSGDLVHKPQFILLNNEGIIQPGTTGTWKGKSFTILGRFRAWFEESVINYWTIQFDNGTIHWLGEGYGIYFLLEKCGDPLSLTTDQIEKLSIGQRKNLKPHLGFVVEKKYRAVKWEIEGELFIPDNFASTFGVIEMSNPAGKNLTYFVFPKDNIVVFETIYTSFPALGFNNLKPYTNEGRSFTCGSCSTPLLVKTYPFAQSCACIRCGTQYAIYQGNEFRKGAASKGHDTPVIPLGTRGIVKDIDYEVIGYVQKEEDNIYRAKWREFTLYNPEHGFAFLSEYDGHWIYLREDCDSPVLGDLNNKEFALDERSFKLFNSYSYEILNARGEFPYNIFDNQNTKAQEYISPPHIWIQERDNKEGITWFKGEHISPQTVSAAFNVTNMPYRTGFGAVQPTGAIKKENLFAGAFFAALILLFLHFGISISREERAIFDDSLYFPDTVNQVSRVTEKFILDKRRSNLRFDIEAPVSNSWFQLDAMLVNAVTGKEYSLEKGVEYYFGYSGGESWTEGSRKENAYLSRIPGGTYFLQFQGLRENSLNKPGYFSLKVTYDVPVHRNLWWSLILLLVWPIGNYVLGDMKEKARWSNSPFNPYE